MILFPLQICLWFDTYWQTDLFKLLKKNFLLTNISAVLKRNEISMSFMINAKDFHNTRKNIDIIFLLISRVQK